MEAVFDCSSALACGLPDERSQETDIFLERLTSKDALWVPALFWYELGNALAMAQRKKRIDQSDFVRLTSLYSQLPTRTDPLLGHDALFRLGLLSTQHQLSVYDSAYLELAQRRALPLLTRDEHLARVAEGEGIQLG